MKKLFISLCFLLIASLCFGADTTTGQAEIDAAKEEAKSESIPVNMLSGYVNYLLFGDGDGYSSVGPVAARERLRFYHSQPESPNDEDRITIDLDSNGQAYARVRLLCIPQAAITDIWFYETGLQDGQLVELVNGSTGTNQLRLDWESQVAEIPTTILSPGDTFVMVYSVDRLRPYDKTIIISVDSIERPTLLTSELNDTSTPHVLLARELKGTILTNSGAGGSLVWQLPTIEEGMNFKVRINAAQNITITPASGEQLYLKGSQMAANESIVNTAPTIGEVMECEAVGTMLFCDSTYADFAQETP